MTLRIYYNLDGSHGCKKTNVDNGVLVLFITKFLLVRFIMHQSQNGHSYLAGGSKTGVCISTFLAFVASLSSNLSFNLNCTCIV